MLILNRNSGESFTIDGNIKVKVLSNHGIVRIGIEAPKEIRIIRDESNSNSSASQAFID